MNQFNRYTQVISVLMLGLSIAGIMACSSSSGHVGTPPNAKCAGNVEDGGTSDDAGSNCGSANASVEKRVGWGIGKIQSGSEYIEWTTGLKLSPEERSRVDQCPRRPWSKNVPSQACTEHTECGDGFCDRGQCTAIYTCLQNLGARCETNDHCPYLLCINGRCSSCATHDECKKRDGQDHHVCLKPGLRAPGRTCGPGPWTSPPYDKKARCPYEPPDKQPDYCDKP